MFVAKDERLHCAGEESAGVERTESAPDGACPPSTRTNAHNTKDQPLRTHGETMPSNNMPPSFAERRALVKKLLDNNTKIIDLAADFRLQNLDDFSKWYGLLHTCPEVLGQAVYGLPEINRDKIKSANVIGNPGCYPTTAILGLNPVIKMQNQQNTQLIGKHIVIDAKSGVSGAGRNAKMGLLFSELSDNFSAYGVAGHRHQPEIEQGIFDILSAKFPQHIRFVPHLVPMIRGMFSTIHLTLSKEGTAIDWQSVFASVYQDEPFIDVLPNGCLPDTRSVRASNRLKIAICQNNAQETLTVLVVQDNLVKGAAGQAIQNMNLLFGLPETLGLQNIAVMP